MRAVFEFLPSVSEELPLFTGDVIEVLSVLDEFWLLGNKDGVTGNVSGVIITKNKPIWWRRHILFAKKNVSLMKNYMEKLPVDY